ncbi:YybH family protein [Amycolatopsis lexingtonensis]|uniref:YybH family protein n=1 Tax=Amycolatopsis lexingtonensis TaxID=218822 RepID=UPI003F6E5BB7
MDIALTTDAARHPAVFAAAFNSGDPGALDRVYEDSGILVAKPGEPLTGAGRRAANGALQRLGHPIDVRPRHVYVAGDLALLIVDWSIGTDVSGTATDVARRGPDGKWRYAIDNPFGVAR